MQYFSMANSYWGAVNQSFGKSWDFGPIGWNKSESLLPPPTVGKNRDFWLLKTSLIFQVIS